MPVLEGEQPRRLFDSPERPDGLVERRPGQLGCSRAHAQTPPVSRSRSPQLYARAKGRSSRFARAPGVEPRLWFCTPRARQTVDGILRLMAGPKLRAASDAGAESKPPFASSPGF